jgi:hypothetical protein
MAYSHKDRYNRLKALQICTSCGKKPARPGRITCEECYKIQKSYSKDMRSLQNDVVILPERPKPKYTLEQINAMAAERGISYGQMVALLDQKEGRYGKKSQ